MSQAKEAENDIRRLLAMTWRTWGNEPLDASSITRTWSLDLGWLAPTDAEILLTKLLAKGWLVSKNDMLTSNTELDDVSVPLGWFPRTTVLDQPPNCPQISTEKDTLSIPSKSNSAGREDVNDAELDSSVTDGKISDDSEINNVEGDGNTPDDSTESDGLESIVEDIGLQSYNVPTLLQLISKESNLARQEVMRRAQRKRKSLGHVTIWMALILVARELQVDLENLIPSDN